MSGQQYQLSANLVGHENDVKGLVFPDSNTIGSVSRDCTLRVWRREGDSKDWSAPKTLYKAQRYLNSVTVNRGLFVSGGQDAKVSVVSEDSHPFPLSGHESNVCALDSKDNLLISASWDSSARVWANDAPKYTLDGHQAAVWDAKIVDESRFLTAGADKKILLWKNNVVDKTFVGHEDVVRGVCPLDKDTFASCSNDGTIKIWGYDGTLKTTLYGHTNYIYQLAKLPTGELVSVGEDGEMRIWNSKETVQAIALPDISVWCVAADQSGSGDFAVAGSDYIIRVFSRDESRWAPQEERDHLADSVANKVNTTDIDESQIKDRSVLKSPPEKEGQVVMVRADNGSIEAHQSTGGQWIRVGEVVNAKEAAAKGGDANSKKELDGKMYDYVFNVNIEDGKPELPLPYNSDENPYDSARRFLEKNELPMSYLDEVAQFITKNAVVRNTQQAPNPYADRGTEQPSQAPPPTEGSGSVAPLKVIPHGEYVRLVQYQPDPIFKALSDKNSKQSSDSKLSDQELENIREGLDQMDASKAQTLFATTAKIASEWSPEDILPVLDVFRIAVGYHPQPQAAVAVQVIFSTLDPGAPKHALLATRALVNLFSTSEGRKIAASKDVRENALEAVNKLVETNEGNTAAKNIAVASLMLNYSIIAGTDVDNALALLRTMAFMTPKMQDSESRYRLLLAVGTVVANNRNDYVKQEAQELGLSDWVQKVEKPDERTGVLVEEIRSVL